MAGDLIPPPSPAGRPSPDPEPHGDPFAAASEPEPAAAASEPPVGPSQFRARFGFVTGALLGCAVAAATLALTLAGPAKDPDDGLAPNWSKWKPSTRDAYLGAEEIAGHIQGTYRNEKRRQLASVRGGPLTAGQVPLSAVVMPRGDDVEVFNGLGVQYTLGGFGEEGALKDSKPSKERHRLLRREALELALYSFRYLPDVTMVVTLLPPAPKVEQILPTAKPDAKKKAKAEPFQNQAIFYRPGDLKDRLTVPLRHTIGRAAAVDRRPPRRRGGARRHPDAVEPVRLLAPPGAGRARLPRARAARAVARAREHGHARVLREPRVLARQQAHRELGSAAGADQLLVAAGVAQPRRRPAAPPGVLTGPPSQPAVAEPGEILVVARDALLDGVAVLARVDDAPHRVGDLLGALGRRPRAHLVHERQLEALDLLLGGALAQR